MKIRHCPFCGDGSKVNVRRMGNSGYSVVCANCGGKGPYIKTEDYVSKFVAQNRAKQAWNRRFTNAKH